MEAFFGPSGSLPCTACPAGHVSAAGSTDASACKPTTSAGGQQWSLSTADGQSCDDACAALSGGSPRPCMGARFSEVASETYFVENVQGGADCGGGVSGPSSWSGAPSRAPSDSKCLWGPYGDCSSAGGGDRRFCPCACPSGAYSDTGDASACKP